MQISKHVAEMQFSPIRRFNQYADKAAANGIKVYKVNIGQPDIATPDCFFDAIRNFDESVIAYEESYGNSILLDAIREYFKRDYDIEFGNEDVIVTMGASEAITMTFSVILDPGDTVLMAEPFYANYSTFISQAGGSIDPVMTYPEDGYTYADRDKLEAALTPKTRAIACVDPSNPTGVSLSEDDMRIIADFAIDHDLWLIADEGYREYIYDGRKPHSFAAIDDIEDRLIVIDSVSKRFSACGARIGFAASKNGDFMDGMLKLAQGRLCVPTIDQIGAAELFRLPHSYYDEMKAVYEARRDAAYAELSKIPGVVCKKPGGSFYLMAELPIDDAEEFLMFMLTEFRDNDETVMYSPGGGFYATPGCGTKEIRIAYVLNSDDMRRSCELIRLGIEAYNNR